MYEYRPNDESCILIFGRTVRQDPLPLFWTASGIEFSTDSSEIYAEIECDYGEKEIFVRFEMDGVCLQRFMVMKGCHEYCIIRGFEGGEMKKVRIILEGQPMEDDESRHLFIRKIKCDKALQPAKRKDLKIEFVGDSLTSGEGLGASAHTNIWCAGIYGLNGHYAYTTANHFDADYSVVSQSGWGVYCGWDNNMNSNIPSVYEKVCGVVKGSENDRLGASAGWDFAAWQPDFIVVNLGTNDGNATASPAWTDPATGISYKLGRDGAGKPDGDSVRKFEDCAVDFMKTLRRCNPDAQIIWAYGMCDHFMEEYILEAIDTYRKLSADEKITYLSLPECKKENLGAHEHPGPADHTAAAQVLINAIEKLR